MAHPPSDPANGKKVGLALSGGGFRATLYHLGLVRFLRDAGILRDVSHITAVSGGSIIGAHLALNWDRYTGSDTDFNAAAGELLDFIRLDVRNRIVRRFPLGFLLRGPRRLVRMSNRKLTRTGLLEYHYEKFLYGDRSLFELPERPQLHILATNLSEGRLTSFNREGLWLIRREPGYGFRIDRIKASLATVPMGVAASSAFPGFFPPMQLTGEDIGAERGVFGRQSYTDGGVFDNLGVRMFHFLAKSAAADERHFDCVLVSDVGKPFKVLSDNQTGGVVRTAMRSSDILMDRVWQLESETFKDAAGYAFARITDFVDPKHDPTTLHPEIQHQLPVIRTDLDRFSPLEIRSLVHHGYCVARNVCRALPQVFGTQLPSGSPWEPPLEARSAPSAATPAAATLESPKPQAAAPALAASALAASQSHRVPAQTTKDARSLHRSAVRRIWSTLADYRDWTTFVYVPIIVPLLVIAPSVAVHYYETTHRLGQIVQSLAQGSQDVEQMKRLLEGPVDRFTGVPSEVRPSAETIGKSGFTILQDLRMVDLRQWRPGAENSPDSYVYGYRRMTVRRDRDNTTKHDFRVSVLALAANTQVRFPAQRLRPRLFSWGSGISEKGEQLMHWEVGVDFTSVPMDEPTELIYEHISPGKFLREGIDSVTMPFDIEIETAEISRWLLMPQGKRYKSYQIIRYPTGKPEQSESVKVATQYMAEDRTILAYKLLGLKPGYTHELTWIY